MRRLLLIVATTLLALQSLHAQHAKSFGIAYYNVDKLYDTLPSPFYDDRAYTPKSRLSWNSERYCKKINNIVSVIDSMSLPLIALYGVENEQVVKDIVRASKNDYAYIHKNADSYNGLDFALLYFGDVFFPSRYIGWKGALYIEGEVNNTPLTVIISHGCKSLGVLLNKETTPLDSKIIILGEVGKLNFNKLNLHDALLHAETQGRGNRILQGVWEMHDRILTNITNFSTADVYARSWLFDSFGYPLPSYKGGKYVGGYSSWLPIYIYFEK